MIGFAAKSSANLADDTVINRAHVVDWAYARIGRRSRLFVHGWGDEAVLEEVVRRDLFRPSPAALAITWERPEIAHGLECSAGHFISPAPGLPDAVRLARVRRVRSVASPRRRACVILAGSREEGFALRESIYRPLASEPDGIDLVLLENPFYGLRRPPGQKGANLRTVAEHALMNIGIVAEGHALVEALRAEGYPHLGVAGYSMGGYMAALVASFTNEPLAVAAMAAGSSPAPVFTHGGLSHSIDFATLGGSAMHEAAARARLFGLFDTARATRWPAPAHTESAVLLACRRDGYVPASETRALHAHWPKSELRWIDAGHISALFTERRALRAAVRDAFTRLSATRSTSP